MANPQVGDVLGGKFRVERVLGTGGMGVVLAAFHLQLEQRVALKLLQAEAAKQPEVVTRFAREARAAARIQSEHVARVLDVGTLQTGEPYMVMEYLEGDDLEALLRSKGPLPVVDIVGWVLQACEAIAEAHAMGIVHRDLKPANLYLAERTDGSRTVKVLDFGISKVLEGTVADASLTRTSAVMGSPMYMSPEQLRSARDVDARADIWALGITLYELFCGKGPFSTGTVPEVCAAILKDAPQPPCELRRELPEGLQAVVLRCLEKDVARRFANTAELALALLSYGPPGSEVSIERISRVLQKGSRSLRGPALPVPDGALPQSEPRSHAVVELTATKPSRSGTSLEEALAQTKLERRADPPEPPPPADPRATASATSISSWDGRQALAQRPRSRAAFVIAGVVGLALVSGVVIALSSGGGDDGQAGEAAPPSEVTPPPLPMPPTQPDVPAADVPPVATITSAPDPSASGRPAASVEIVRGPLPKPRTSASAAAGSPTAEPTSAATAAPSSSATAAATTAPTAAPTAAATASAKAAPKPAPSSTPTSKP